MRIAAYIGLFFSALLTPFPVFVFFALLYIFFWEGYEVIVIGIVIDSVFGTKATSFLYTGAIGVLLLVFTLLRPRLSWYKNPL